jgi:hypothetical protein
MDEIQLKKDEIHKKIDDCFNIITKGMDSIFDKIKLNEIQVVEDVNNLEVLTSAESISARLVDLTRIVYDMKVELLKRAEYDKNKKKVLHSEVTNLNGLIKKRLNQFQENYNFINSLLKENKNNKYYKYSLNFNITDKE